MKVRLLIVDDEEMMVEMLKRFMEPLCSLMDSTDKLTQAVEMASKNNYNLCILDLRLNGTGKEEAYHCIRTIKSYKCSVIVVSGIPEPDIERESLAAGADAFVRKGDNLNAHKLLLAANIAVLHLPRESFKSSDFSEHVHLLQQMVQSE